MTDSQDMIDILFVLPWQPNARPVITALEHPYNCHIPLMSLFPKLVTIHKIVH